MYIVINQTIQTISLSTFTRRNVNSFLHSFFRPDFDVEDDLVVLVSESFQIVIKYCEVLVKCIIMVYFIYINVIDKL